uniref:cell division protein FtsQ/DivIB n=1 Tax=Chamaesiphon sp. VAR_48_metabat_403 TaxID=2964700 RepID=UPI00286E5B06
PPVPPSPIPVYHPESQAQIEQRRQQLRQHRQIRVVKSVWRFTCMSGILAGVGWTIYQPGWTISKPEQIQIEGNQYLSDTTVRSMLEITYPKPILELDPAELTEQLATKLAPQPIERSSVNVKIDRRVFPPQPIVQIQDLPPVARIMQTSTTHAQMFIDERGLQLPISSYRPIVWKSLPTLQLRLPIQGTCPGWSQLYRAIRTSPVTVGIVDCHNSQNVILQTEVGKIRLGSIGNKSKITNQMQQLDRLRNWQKHPLSANADLLDLENPDSPRLQLSPASGVPAQVELK